MLSSTTSLKEKIVMKFTCRRRFASLGECMKYKFYRRLEYNNGDTLRVNMSLFSMISTRAYNFKLRAVKPGCYTYKGTLSGASTFYYLCYD